ncbi:MAG: hypothetical protein Q9227_002837 [Pyrenula ochraceoflavens]
MAQIVAKRVAKKTLKYIPLFDLIDYAASRGSKPQDPLPPLGNAIGMFGDLIARDLETIFMKEKKRSLPGTWKRLKAIYKARSWSDRMKIVRDIFSKGFDVKNADGIMIFEIEEGKISHKRGRKRAKALYSTSINSEQDKVRTHLLTVRKRRSNPFKGRICKSFYAELPSKDHEKVLKLNGNIRVGSEKNQSLSNNTESNGNNRGKKVETVACIERQLLSVRQIFFGKKTYKVEIAKGMDRAIVLAMVVGFDERWNEK